MTIPLPSTGGGGGAILPYNPTKTDYLINDTVYDTNLTWVKFRCIQNYTVAQGTPPSENPDFWLGEDVDRIGDFEVKGTAGDSEGYIQNRNAVSLDRTKYIRAFRKINPQVELSTVAGSNVIQVESSYANKIGVGFALEGAGIPAGTTVTSLGMSEVVKVGSMLAGTTRINLPTNGVISDVLPPADINNPVIPNNTSVLSTSQAHGIALGGYSLIGSTFTSITSGYINYSMIGLGDYVSGAGIQADTRITGLYPTIPNLNGVHVSGNSYFGVSGLTPAQVAGLQNGRYFQGVNQFFTTIRDPLISPLGVSYTNGVAQVGISPEVPVLTTFNRFVNTNLGVQNITHINGLLAGADRTLNFPMKFNPSTLTQLNLGVPATITHLNNTNTLFSHANLNTSFTATLATAGAVQASINTYAGDLALYSSNSITVPTPFTQHRYGIMPNITSTLHNNNFNLSSVVVGINLNTVNVGTITGSARVFTNAYTGTYRVNQNLTVTGIAGTPRISAIVNQPETEPISSIGASSTNLQIPVGAFLASKHYVNRRFRNTGFVGDSYVASITAESTLTNAATLTGQARLYFAPTQTAVATGVSKYIQNTNFPVNTIMFSPAVNGGLQTFRYLNGSNFMAWTTLGFANTSYVVGQQVDTATQSRITLVRSDVGSTASLTNASNVIAFSPSLALSELIVGRVVAGGSIPTSTFLNSLTTNGFSFTGTTTNGSPTITVAFNPTLQPNLAIGQMMSGTGIPANTRITAMTATTITISLNATATGSPTLTTGATGVLSANATGNTTGGAVTLVGGVEVDQVSTATVQQGFNFGVVYQTNNIATATAVAQSVILGTTLGLNTASIAGAVNSTAGQWGLTLDSSVTSTATSQFANAQLFAYATIDSTIGTPVVGNNTNGNTTLGSIMTTSVAATGSTSFTGDVGQIYTIQSAATSTSTNNNASNIQPILNTSAPFTVSNVTASSLQNGFTIDKTVTATNSNVTWIVGPALITEFPATTGTILSNFSIGSSFTMSANATTTIDNQFVRVFPYGNGNGTTTFNLAGDPAGRFIAVTGSNRFPNQNFGNSQVILTGQQSGIQSHTVTISGTTSTAGNHGHNVNLGNQGGGGGTTINNDTGANGNYFTGFGGQPIIQAAGDHSHTFSGSQTVPNTNAITPLDITNSGKVMGWGKQYVGAL